MTLSSITKTNPKDPVKICQKMKKTKVFEFVCLRMIKSPLQSKQTLILRKSSENLPEKFKNESNGKEDSVTCTIRESDSSKRLFVWVDSNWQIQHAKHLGMNVKNMHD